MGFYGAVNFLDGGALRARGASPVGSRTLDKIIQRRCDRRSRSFAIAL